MDNAFNNTYRASELIVALQKLIAAHGDLPVVTKDPDTGWRMEIGVVHRPEKRIEEWPERIEIRTSYYGRPDGAKTHNGHSFGND